MQRHRITLFTIFLVQSLLLVYNAIYTAPTKNEAAHLVAGVAYLQYGRFDVYPVNPPLVKCTAAIPSIVLGCKTDWKNYTGVVGQRTEVMLGFDFVEANGSRFLSLLRYGRILNLLWILPGLLVCYFWAKELYGRTSGLAAAILYASCPMILGHGPLITSDAASASLSLAACYSFWKWLRTPSWQNTVSSGLILGIAESIKTTLLVFYPLWPLLWFMYRFFGRGPALRKSFSREICMLFARMLLSLCVVNIVYLFEGTFTPLGEFNFVSKMFRGDSKLDEPNPQGFSEAVGNRFRNSKWHWIPVPLPKSYLMGIDLQRRDFEDYSTLFFLYGKWSESGWWYYYLAAALVKLPVGTMLLLMSSMWAVFSRSRVPVVDRILPWIIGIILFCFVSSQTGINEHFRYVLPAIPLMYVSMSGIFESSRKPENSKYPLFGFLRAFAFVALFGTVAGSLFQFPHSLAFFNYACGGPSKSIRYLRGSSVDWGQDVLRLTQWCERLSGSVDLYVSPSIRLTESGSAQNAKIAPSTIRPPLLTDKLDVGYYAFSANDLPAARSNGDKVEVDAVGNWFSKQEPIAMIGNTIRVYNVTKPISAEMILKN